tara:strand:- start:784 stop:1149 length:366 start_codon:yes stop_codon:yes gene_type:complete
MNKKEILNTFKTYSNYGRFLNKNGEISCKINNQHLKSLKFFIDGNINLITNCTWYDLAGGFMMFCVEINKSTYCISNEFWDGENNTTIYHDLTLKAYIELEKNDYDMGLLLQEDMRINRIK